MENFEKLQVYLSKLQYADPKEIKEGMNYLVKKGYIILPVLISEYKKTTNDTYKVNLLTLASKFELKEELISSDFINFIISDFFQTQNMYLKATIVKFCGKLYFDRRCVELVVKALKNSDNRVKANAIEAINEIAKITDEPSCNRFLSLIEPLTNHSNPRVKINALITKFNILEMKKNFIANEILMIKEHETEEFQRSAEYAVKQLKLKTKEILEPPKIYSFSLFI